MAFRIIATQNAQSSPRYYAHPNVSGEPDRLGWWIVTEGNYVTAPIVAHCPTCADAKNIAQAMNFLRWWLALIARAGEVVTNQHAQSVN
jgi:hypothetical protein